MVRSVLGKVAWAGRTASMVFGLALVLALVIGVAATALGANGGNFILGKTNVATLITRLAGPVGVNGTMFEVQNNNSGADDTALSLKVQSGEAPMKVNSDAEVANLNADLLDGKNATGIGVNGLQRVEEESLSNSTSPKQITASCPTGKVLVGTGFDVFGGKRSLNTGNAKTDVVIDFVIPGSTSVTVAAYEEEEPLEDWSVKAIAICATAGTP